MLFFDFVFSCCLRVVLFVPARLSMSFVLYNFYAITANGLFYPRAAPVLFSLFSRRFFLDFAFFFGLFVFFTSLSSFVMLMVREHFRP